MYPTKPDYLEMNVPQEFVDEVKNYIDSSELDKVNYDYFISLVDKHYNLKGKEAKEKLEELNSMQVSEGRGKVPIPTLKFKLWYFHEEENDTEKLISNTMFKKALQANNTYNFDLDYNHMVIQLAKYEATERGHFLWHTDGHINFKEVEDKDHQNGVRKISSDVCIQPAEEGGEFLLQDGWELLEKDSTIKTLSLPFESIPETPGKGILFPSYYNHCVTPVTKGERYVLISWVFGPEWK